MAIDHDGILVPADKHQEIIDWYLTALKPLDYVKIAEVGPGGMAVGLGADNKPDWWIVKQMEGQIIGSPRHTAFTSSDRAKVDAYHAAAIAAGGECNGPPGPRPHYGGHYYAAFVRDPLGNNIEVVCHHAP